jgi:hypothetical protein
MRRTVRVFHFHAVGSLFVPAFNILLASMNQDELRKRQPIHPASSSESCPSRKPKKHVASIKPNPPVLRTEEYFSERSRRADVTQAKRILKRAGKGKPPVSGDERS